MRIHHVLPALTVVCFLLLVTSCSREKKEYAKKDNFYYKLLAIGDGKIKPDTSDYLLLDAACLTLKDSVFWDTRHDAHQRFLIRANQISFGKHLYSLSEGDSVQYLVPTLDLFRDMFQSPKAAYFCERDSCVKFSARILRIVSKDEYNLVLDSLRGNTAELQQNEYAQIYNYVTLNFKQAKEFRKDAFLQVIQPSQGDSIRRGSKVSIRYTAYFLDGRAADISASSKPFEFTMGQEGQVIEGLRLALYHLKKGEKAKIILPSRLAFGNQGSSNGSIAPYTPLLYEAEILDVK